MFKIFLLFYFILYFSFICTIIEKHTLESVTKFVHPYLCIIFFANSVKCDHLDVEELLLT